MRIIAGAWRGRVIDAPPGMATRPTADRVRETLFSMLASRLGSFEELRVADLFAGSGALGFEAASRGAERVVMVERNARAARQLRENQARLAARAIEIAEADGLKLAASLAPRSFDVVFLDPPFGEGMLSRALELALPLVADDGWLYVESGEPLDEDDPLLAGWLIVRGGKAGAVHYHLLQRENDE